MSRWRRKSDEDVSEADAVARWDAFQNMLGSEQQPAQNGGWRLPGQEVPPQQMNGSAPPEGPAAAVSDEPAAESSAESADDSPPDSVDEPVDEPESAAEHSEEPQPGPPEPLYDMPGGPSAQPYVAPPQQRPAPQPYVAPPPDADGRPVPQPYVAPGPYPPQYGPPQQYGQPPPGPQWTVQQPYPPPVQQPPVPQQQQPQPGPPPWQQNQPPRPSQPPHPPETPAFVWTEEYGTGGQPVQPQPPAQQGPPVPPGPAQQGPPQQMWGATPYMAGPPSPAPTSPPANDSLSAQALIARRGRGSGWRKAVSGISRPGHGKAEWRRQLIAQATMPVRGCYRIAVISLKGGVGKTTSTVCIGATLASLRGDRVIAVDANPDRGTLSGKIPLQTTATVRNLLNDADRIQSYSDVRRYTSQSPDRLEVLASETDPSVSLAFGEEDYRRVAELLERFYNVVLTDCGTGLLHSAMAGVLALADQIVVVSSGSVDGARSASATLDWLEAHGYSSLVANGLAVINSVRPKSGGVNLDALEQHFAARCRSVTRIPYDPHLELGAEVDLAELHQSTRDALLELAAKVAAGFPRDPQYGPGPMPMGIAPGPVVAASVVDGTMAPAPFLPPEPSGPPPGPPGPAGPAGPPGPNGQ